jgi:DNA-binding Lrp family transcriptional regulator
MAKQTKEHILKDEIKLITELQKDSNERLNLIAKRCGFSRQKAWRLIKQLEKNNLIWGYTAICDEEKLGLKHFTFIAKRSSNKIDEKTVDTIISRKLEEAAANLGVTVENSYYVHGEYDWILTATAEDIIQAKRFSDLLLEQYPKIFEKITIMQAMIFIKKQHVLNPEKEKLRNFL